MLSSTTSYNSQPSKRVRSRVTGNDLRITVNDIVVRYNDHGPANAPAIIFIHGFPLNKSMWEQQAEALKNEYRIIAYDVRGHGKTEAGKQEFSIDLFVDDLVAFMDALGLKKTMLCGLSMGGYIALRAIEMHPDRFDALVLCDTRCDADTEEMREKRLETIDSIRENGIRHYAEETLKKLVAPESFLNRKDEIKAIREMILNTSKQSLYRTLLAMSIRKETCSRLAKIKVPVLIMTGKKDTVTPPVDAEKMHDQIQNSFLDFIEHAGHIANMENAEIFNANLKKFITRFAK